MTKKDDHAAETKEAKVIQCLVLPSDDDAAKLFQPREQWTSEEALDLAKGCEAWKVTALSAALRSPVQSSAKVLLLSGEIDIRTPPENGTHAAASLSNGTHLIIPHTSHSTVLDPRGAKIMVDYLVADGSMQAVDTPPASPTIRTRAGERVRWAFESNAAKRSLELSGISSATVPATLKEIIIYASPRLSHRARDCWAFCHRSVAARRR